MSAHGVLGVVRNAAAMPGARALKSVTAVVRMTAALRAGLVCERAHFAVNELRNRAVTGRYTLRDCGRPVFIRHHSSDVMILDEIFGAGEYDLPAPVADALAGMVAPAVLDLGANIGLFGVWALSVWPGARIIGYEPDPANADVHERTIIANAAAESWQLRRRFAAADDGAVRFNGGHGSASAATALTGGDGASIEVAGADVFADLASADLVKIDIEGGEWALLHDPRFAGVPCRALFVEYHPYGSAGGDPGAEAERLVRAAGFEVQHEPKVLTPGWGVVWGWRERLG